MVRRELFARGACAVIGAAASGASDHVGKGVEMPVHEVIGVGFGPSNLALAIAVGEHNTSATPNELLRALFIERQPEFGWHRGMLITDATMQISCLKDLVTLRNPSSRFSFLSYLHEHSRLVSFINKKTFFPTRVEFHDYLSWAAAQVSDAVKFSTTVEDIVPVPTTDGTGRIDSLDVVCWSVANGSTIHRARNVVIATGIEPALPPGVERSPRIWHSSEFLDRLEGNRAAREFVVVGAGQSAAEIAGYLHEHLPGSQVHALLSRFGYSPADDSPFANQVFDPAAVDEFFMAPDDVKQQFFDYHGNTNYSVVDLELIHDLYRRVYSEQVVGERRLHVHPFTRLVDVTDEGDRVTAHSQSTIEGTNVDFVADVAVLATGYRRMDPRRVLGSSAQLCEPSSGDKLGVHRDYRVVTAPGVDAGIYLQGGTEHTHGLSSSLLSNAAVRAGEILESILLRRAATIRTVEPDHVRA